MCGADGAQVSAVFANSPGAMELLPNIDYRYRNGEVWLTATLRDVGPIRTIDFPKHNAYTEIYGERESWWRLMDDSLIDPANVFGSTDNAWNHCIKNINRAYDFPNNLGREHHCNTYVNYGADPKHKTWGNINWKGFSGVAGNLSDAEFAKAKPLRDDGIVTVYTTDGRRGATLEIPVAGALDENDLGDGTVPFCSGSAPLVYGGESIQQSFPMSGFDHQHSYDNEDVRWCTLYSIGKILSSVPLG